MLIANNYSIITKKYPLRLRTARKRLIQLFIQKDFIQQCEDTFFFNDKELLNTVYTNVWFALEFIQKFETRGKTSNYYNFILELGNERRKSNVYNEETV
jgi:hypothetical protein